ncbi:MAG: asparagine synthase (glutamine-hydrolyzing) [Chloroherpetonaceae bacterium]|nr:asparagine synthase (glutamine-hydrolyzing) [Chloroherpetonaceae bacterium]
MCGIVGIYNFSGPERNLSESVLESMRDSMIHRGPDDSGIFVSPNRKLGFGFRRLSIVDLSPAGHQPMTTTDNRFTIVFNGEVYNHLSIRKDLEKRGYRFRSTSDTETILYAFQEFGLGCISKFYGMFAIAVWDNFTEELFLIRDRVGIKPLYYSFFNGCFVFSSEIKAILKHPSFHVNLNHQAISDYLTFLSSPPEKTLFEGISKLPAGHFAVLSKSGEYKLQRYWSLHHQSESYDKSQFRSEPFCVDELRRLLRDSVKLRMMSDVPFGVFLSGGIDSSLNVALMSELMARPVDTFSVGFKDFEKYNELHYARLVSKQFSTNHHEILIDESDAVGFIDQMLSYQDEPNADPVNIPLYFVSKLARESGTIVVQVGEGSDEEFSGYSHFHREWLFYHYYHQLVPTGFRELFYSLSSQFSHSSLISDYARRSLQLQFPFYGGAFAFTDIQKDQLFMPSYKRMIYSASRYSSEYFSTLSSDVGYYSKMMFTEFQNRLPELLLMRVDKMSMACSIEARVPFLDHRIAEFAFQIPDSLKVRDGETKYILKKAAEGIIPNEIIYRKKQGFAAPVSDWMRNGKLNRIVKETMFRSKLLSNNVGSLGLQDNHAFFSTSYVKSLFHQHESGKVNFHYQLWSLFLLALWYEKHF